MSIGTEKKGHTYGHQGSPLGTWKKHLQHWTWILMTEHLSKFYSDDAEDPIIFGLLLLLGRCTYSTGDINFLYMRIVFPNIKLILREILHLVNRQDLLKSMGCRVASGHGSLVWSDQQQWHIRSWRLFPFSNVHVLETISSKVVYRVMRLLCFWCSCCQFPYVAAKTFTAKIRFLDSSSMRLEDLSRAGPTNMQEQNQNMQNQMTNLTEMLTKFMNANSTSTSGSSSLPSDTVANPRGDMKAITTRNGVSYDGPQVPPPPSSLPKVVEHEPEVTKVFIRVHPSTKNIQPPEVQTQNDEPVVAPKTKPTIPYPSRINKEKLREKDDLLTLKFMEMFRNLHFELSFADALLHMPKFAPMFRKLLNNKDKK
ncbi:hypothetical protein Tco_0143904 [Tanacetum coccineum]